MDKDKKKINDFDDSLFEDNDEKNNDNESEFKKISFDFDDEFEDDMLLSIKPKISDDALKMFADDDDNDEIFVEQRNDEIKQKVHDDIEQKIFHNETNAKINKVSSKNTKEIEVKEQYIDINNPFKNEEINYISPKKENDSQEELYQEIDVVKIKSIIESALYVVGQTGVSIGDLRRMTNASSATIKKILKDWANDLEKDNSRGILIKQFGDYYKFYSKPNNKEDLNKLITIKYKNPLSSKVMEVLAIIAYNQPCTKAIIEEIRLKDPSGTIQKLIDLGLVIDAGRASTPGCPILYTVTPKFYDIFGIKSLSELPKITIDQPYFDENTSFFDTTRFED